VQPSTTSGPVSLAIETHDLTKVFRPQTGWRRLQRQRPTTAVSDVSLAVPAGQIFGLLGPNGAGKTTLTKLLCTLIRPTSGRATVAGIPLEQGQAIRRVAGLVVTDERSFYWRLSGRRNLEFFAAMHGLYHEAARRRIDEMLLAVNMRDDADTWFSRYSTGMRQRLAIARALLHRPSILFLDEPSRSLDPVATRQLHTLIRDLVDSQGMTVFLITHDMSEAESLCQQVAVMHQGRIQIVGHPGILRRELGSRRHYLLTLSAPLELSSLPVDLDEISQEAVGEQALLRFTAPESGPTLSRVLQAIEQQHVTVHSIDGIPPTMEDVFDHFTQHQGA
jgi:ABC-2 type transport system ATP-binding protein